MKQQTKQIPDGYKQTEVGVIPEDWEIKALCDVLKSTRLGGNYSNQAHETDRALIKMGNIGRGSISTEKLEYIPEDVKVDGEDELRYGDLLFNTRNTLELVGKVAIWRNEVPNAYFNSNLLRLEFIEDIVSNNFYANYQFNTKQSIQQLKGFATGTTSVAAIYTRDLYQYQIIVPPIIEQTAIANVLSDTDALIEKLEKQIEKKKAIKQGAMQQLLTGKKRLPGFSGEWEEKKLGEVTHIKTGGKNNEDKTEGGLYPFFVRSQTVERINSYSYDCEAILVPGEGGIGSIFHYINGKFDYHQRVYKISHFADDIDGKFVYYYLVQFFNKQAMQNSVKATVDSLRLPTFLEFELRIPVKKGEQTAIATVLSDMDAEIEALKEKLEKYKQIKAGMMQQLLTGKIRLVN